MSPSDKINDFGLPSPDDLATDPMLQLTRIFVYFLQNLFRGAPDGLGCHWDPDQTTTDVIISNEKPTLEALEKKPHIICVLGDLQWGGIGLDQLQFQKMMRKPSRTHTDLVSMTIAYHCQARDGLHAHRLAWWSSYFTNVYRRLIMRKGHLHQVDVKHRVTGESGATAYTGPIPNPEIVSSIVTVPFYWQPQWRIKDISETMFRGVRFTMNVTAPDVLYSAGRVGKLRQPTMYGRPVVSLPISPKPSTFQQVVVDTATDEEE
jgi:hypothetical protein